MFVLQTVCGIDISWRLPESLMRTVTDSKTQPADQDFQRKQFYREVGMRIKALREKKRLTQETIAISVSLSRTSLTNIERGRQKLLLHTFANIASLLGVTISELVPGQSAVPEELND